MQHVVRPKQVLFFASYTHTCHVLSLIYPLSLFFRLVHDMREREIGSSASYAGASAAFSDGGREPGYLKHLDQSGKRKTIKPDSYFSDEDASD